MVRYIKLSVSGKTFGPQLILDLISLSPSSWDPPHPPLSKKINILKKAISQTRYLQNESFYHESE